LVEDEQELREMERDIGQPDIGPVHFKIGRLAVLHCGSGWLKVTIHHKPYDCESELLPPEEAKSFVEWIAGAGVN